MVLARDRGPGGCVSAGQEWGLGCVWIRVGRSERDGRRRDAFREERRDAFREERRHNFRVIHPRHLSESLILISESPSCVGRS